MRVLLTDFRVNPLFLLSDCVLFCVNTEKIKAVVFRGVWFLESSC